MAINIALLFEREKLLKGATFHVMGRKGAERYKGTVIEIRRFERIRGLRGRRSGDGVPEQGHQRPSPASTSETGQEAKEEAGDPMASRSGGVTETSLDEGLAEMVEICPGCGERMAETGAVTVYCDEKGRPVELIRLCGGCAELFATGTAEERVGLFERIGEIESAFFVCQVLEKGMAVH